MPWTDNFSDNELSLDRTFEVGNNVLHVRRKDPYGFWTCHYEKGPVPQELSGSYTSFYEAEKAVLGYLNSKGREVTASKTV